MMKKCVVIEPHERFSYEDGWSIYKCPQCASAVGFSSRNFLSGAEHPRSNLSHDIKHSFDKVRPLRKTESLPYSDENEHFLDFACECGLNVRIVYKLPWRSYEKADWREASIVAVVESFSAE